MTQEVVKMAEHYLVVYSCGPAWIAGKPFHEQKLLAHGNYMHSLYTKGILLEGGPFTDSSGGMALIVVQDKQQAEDILSRDPAIVDGVFTAALRPWMRVDWATYGE
jgi:uncharacterized protein YciI